MSLPVSFEATVTYYRKYDFDLFVQQDGEAVYVYFEQNANLVPGDRIRIQGRTEDSFRPVVISDTVTLLHHGEPPDPVPAQFEQLIRASLVCVRVSIRAQVRSADLIWSSNEARGVYLQLLMNGGHVDAAINSDDDRNLRGMLDAEVEITGVVAEKFDGKKHPIGVSIWVQSLAEREGLEARPIQSCVPAAGADGRDSVCNSDSGSNPEGSRAGDHYLLRPRHLHRVAKRKSESLWIPILTDAPMRVGDLADVTGFPDVRNGFLT